MKLEEYIERGKNTHKRCQAILTAGYRKGNQCRQVAVLDGLCARHFTERKKNEKMQ